MLVLNRARKKEVSLTFLNADLQVGQHNLCAKHSFVLLKEICDSAGTVEEMIFKQHVQTHSHLFQYFL